MPEDVPDISPETAATVSRAIADKIESTRPHAGIEFVTVQAISFDDGLVPMATVTFAGDANGVAQTIPCLTGIAPRVGQRVAVIWDPPAGCYVFGTPELDIVPTVSMSLCCGSPTET